MTNDDVATSALAKPPPRHSEAWRDGTMTRTDARQLADTIAKDLARMAPLTTRYALLCRVGEDRYHVAARMGEEYVLFDSPEAWAKHVEAWERAKLEAAVRARRPDHWVLRAVWMVPAIVGLWLLLVLADVIEPLGMLLTAVLVIFLTARIRTLLQGLAAFGVCALSV
jgi:hypothetical protein